MDLKGYELKTKLAEIISRGHVDKKYSGLWDIYKTADIDRYYENDGIILDIYSENPEGEDPYNFKVGKYKCEKCINEGDCYSREHIIPQSCFGKKSPMKNDAHFVIPTDGAVNKLRGNLPFGEVLKPFIITKNGSKIGINVTEGYSKSVFEPIDEFKGDIARMIFYFVTRYENELPNFSTVDILDDSKNQALKKWELDILLKWHNQDPVSRREIDRNNIIYQIQHNRNPYIDNLSWLCYQKKLSKSDVKASKTIHFYPNLTRKGTIFF